MSVGVFVVFLAVGAGLLALWFDSRFPTLAPESLRQAVLHVCAAFLIGRVVVPLVLPAIVERTPEAALAVAVVAVALPAVAYAFLAGVWVLKLMYGTLRGLPR